MSIWLSYPAMPFILLLVMTLGLVLVDRLNFGQMHASGKPHRQIGVFWYSFFTLLMTLITLLYCYPTYTHPMEYFVGFSGHFVWDVPSALFSLLLVVLSLLVFIYAYPALSDQPAYILPYYMLALFSLLGMLVCITAGSLLVLYLGLALMTVPLYAMVGLHAQPSRLQLEALVKYMVINVLATILLLYGVVLLYGDNKGIIAWSSALPFNCGHNVILLSISVHLILIAFLCKLGTVPFHFWVPDIYQVTPVATTLWIATVPKVALVGILTKLIIINLIDIPVDWRFLLRWSGVLSIILGHIVALRQINIKRLLAYSSIANMGFVLISFTLPVNFSTLAIFYGTSYSFTLAVIVGVLGVLSSKGIGVDSIADLKGLRQRVPSLAFILLLALLMLSGMPPFIGFFAKLGLLHGLITAQQYKMVILLVGMTSISLYYYLHMMKVMYFEPYEDDIVSTPKVNPCILGVFAIHLMVLMYFGLLPDRFINYYEHVMRTWA